MKKAVLTAFILLIFDRLLKFVVWQINTETNWFKLFLNSGIFFLIPFKNLFTAILAILITGFLLYLLIISYKHNLIKQTFGYLLIIIGAGSNFYDRLLYQGVIDYFDFGFLPVFNLADIYIIIGLIVLLANNIKTKKIIDNNKIIS